MRLRKILGLLLCPLVVACGNADKSKLDSDKKEVVQAAQYPKEVFKSEALQVRQISPNTYVHISYLATNDFGNVPCNGMIAVNGDKAIIFDATTTDSTSAVLIRWIKEELKAKPVALLVTHFHEDCLGGAAAFKADSIPSYAGHKTITFTKEKQIFLPEHGFDSLCQFDLNGEKVEARYCGAGHTRDNTVGYFAKDAVLFGGCLVKELNADKGYLGDADTASWPATINILKQAYPNVKLVIPGHGAIGGKELLDYTHDLFAAKASK